MGSFSGVLGVIVGNEKKQPKHRQKIKNCQRSAKLKEVFSYPQADPKTPHLILPTAQILFLRQSTIIPIEINIKMPKFVTNYETKNIKTKVNS